MIFRLSPALIVLLATACGPNGALPDSADLGRDADSGSALAKKGDRDKPWDDDDHADRDGFDGGAGEGRGGTKVSVCHWSARDDAYRVMTVSSRSKHLRKHACDVQAGSYFYDGDADGYGDATSSSVCPGEVDPSASSSGGGRRDAACPDTSLWVTTDGDCDDSDDLVNPDAEETCNAVDDNCDGDIDEDGASEATWYMDLDADGYGDPDNFVEGCDAPSGTVEDSSDCDDSNAEVSPGAAEVCNGGDDDCDGLTDDADTDVSGTLSWYADADADGYGDAAVSLMSCESPSGHVGDNTDCDDTNGAISPEAPEVCNGSDDDCDGLSDDADSDVSGTATWYADADVDGYGDPAVSIMSCDSPAGYVSDDSDCNDSNGAVSPGGSEVCNGGDDDCDGLSDDADPGVSGTATWYADADVDGYGDAGDKVMSCDAPAGYIGDSGDCDDSNGAVSPAGTEVCNSSDDDCDGLSDDADPDVSGTATWYADDDLDGYGDATSSVMSCDSPSGYVDDDSDCDDGDDSVNPDASEACDGIDNDCNLSVDDAPECTTFTVGNDTKLSLNGNFAANTLLGTTITVPDDMTLTAFGVVSRGGGGVQMGLYTDTGAGPGTLVASTDSESATPGTNEFSITGVSISAGTYYIMAVWKSNTPNYYKLDPTKKVYQVAHTFGTTLPSTYAGGSSFNNQDYNYYLVGY
jgi:Putative metal-binding motif